MQFVLATILPLVGIFAIKVLENMLDATKIIFLQKNRHVLSGCVLFVAVLINYYVMKIIVSSEGIAVMVTAAAAAGCGYMLAGKISARFLHGVYINIIFSDDLDAIREIHYFLTEQHIKHKVEDTYNKDLTRKTLSVTAYPNTQAKNKMIKDFIKNSPTKFGHVVVE